MNKVASNDRCQSVQHRRTFKSSIFRGVSIDLNASDGDIEGLARNITKLPGVKQLWPVSLIPAPNAEISWTAEGMPLSEVRRRAEEDTFTPHVMTQVDKLRAEGYTGAGYRIGIVDTGVDYKHPALGGCFGEGCLIEYGADLAGDDFNGYNTPIPDSDPWEECSGHGSHVSGIIAAMENPLGFTGAAPDVKLGMYRVFGCHDYSSEDLFVAGILQAFEDGSDIITGSIGIVNGWSDQALAVIVSRIVAAGVPCIFAAGNDGAPTAFSVASPSSGRGVFSISSFDSLTIPSYDNDTGVVTYTNNTSGGGASYFTSWGPSYELEMKPQFGTPGGNILSTLPLSQGGYGVMSGTSMATPLAAAIVALVSQVN